MGGNEPKIHDQIGKNLNNQDGVPFDITTFDLHKWVELIDKDIMKMLAVSKRTKIHYDNVYEDMLKSHTKKLRCFYLACIIMFCANCECNFPLHTLLADAIGGSTDLIQIFNRLGVVTSKNTHARYVEHVVTQYEEGNHLHNVIKGHSQ